MRVALFIILFVACFYQLAFTQPTQTIRGKVVDQESLMPLLSATVMILEAGPFTGVITDESGDFMIEDVPVGRYTLMISHVGYESLIMREVLVGTGKEVFLEVGMRELVVEMEGVTVAANISKDKALNPMAGISARSFTVEETERYAGSWGDPARLVSNYAGVFPNGDLYNYIVVRGNSPYGIVWRMDGVPIPNPNHFDVPGATGGPISIVNNKLLTRSDFLTGAFPAEYSDGVSGVFDLRMRKGNNQKREYVAEIGLMGIELGAEGPFSKKSDASYMVNFRYSLLGLVDELLWVEALPRYQDLSFKMNFPTKKGEISVFGFGGSSKIFGVIDDTASSTSMYKRQGTDESRAKTGFVGFKHVHFFGSRTRIVSDIAVSTSRTYSRQDSLVNNAVTRLVEEENFREDRLLASSKLLMKLNAKNSVNIGISIENNFVEYYFHDDSKIDTTSGGNRLILMPPEVQKDNNLAILRSFLEWKHRFTNSLTLYTGLNYLYFSLNNSQVLEPRINLRWNFSRKHTLSLGYGLHSQVHPFFHYLTRTNTTEDEEDRENYEETNLDLGFIKSHHFGLGYDLSISRNLRLKAEVYNQELFDIPVERKPSYFSLFNIGAGHEDPDVDSLVNEGTGRNRGIELTLEKFLSNRYYFLVTASVLDSKYKGSDGILRNTAFNNRFSMSALLGYELPVRENGAFDFNVRFVAMGGRRIIPLDEEKTMQEGDEVYLYEQAYEQQLADYVRLDARVGYKYNGRKLRHEIGADVVNLTNRQNAWQYRYDEDSKKIEMDNQQGIFFYIFYRINL